MLRSSLQLSELLRTRPKPIEIQSDPSPSLQHEWSPRRRITPGPFQLMKFKNLKYQHPEPSPINASTEVVDTYCAKFLYDRKLSSTNESQVIRLLNIQPGCKSDPIVSELHYVCCDSLPRYAAISYCWGAQKPSVTIECNRQPLRITENLNSAIETLRREDVSLLLWADAICIDQASIEEKNSQVPLMRLIYEKAAVVHVWLGEDDPAKSCEEAFCLLRELSHAYHDLDWDFNIFTKHSGGKASESCKLPALTDPSWGSLLELVQRPWFSRVWIIQEVVASRNAILRCGRLRLEWKDFCFGFLFAVNAGFIFYRSDVFLHSMAHQQLIPLILTYFCFAESTYVKFDLVSLLQSHRLTGASDLRDKVYALIGLSTLIESETHRIIPDYSLSTEAVYTEVAKAIISKSPSLDILGVPRSASTSLIKKIPSWVPDWSVAHLGSSLAVKNLQGDYIFDFNASKIHSPKCVVFRDDSLILDGHVFDTVVTVCKVMDPFNPFTVGKQTTSEYSSSKPGMLLSGLHIISVLQDWRTICNGLSSTQTYPYTSDNPLEVFCRVIFFDKLPAGYNIASIAHGYGRLAIRMTHPLFSYFYRFPLIQRVVNALESRNIARYALLKQNDDARANEMPDLIARTVRRRMFVTERGYVGLAPEMTEPGCCVAIVRGGKFPLMLKPRECAKWELIGDCYVHGIMHGEGFEQYKCTEIEVV